MALVRSGSTYFSEHLAKCATTQKLFKQSAFVNGGWTGTDRVFDVFDPATGEKLGTCPDMGAAETEQAIQAANNALPAWRNLPAVARGKMLENMATLMMDNQEALARIATAECGKSLMETRGEVGYAASFYKYYGEEARRAFGYTVPTHLPDRRLICIKQPVGVCGFITPWNFPSAMITRKVGPALAAGCTVVCKPSEDTPYSALALAEIAQDAGIPAGVFNVITSSRDRMKESGDMLCESELVRKISFTGSTLVGKYLYAKSANTVKRISLELGGNAPFVVFDDADIDAAVAGLMICKFRASGQTCVCANRVYVQAAVYDEFVSKLAEKVTAMKIGHGFEAGVEQGPLINSRGKDKVISLVEDAKSKNCEVVTGGASMDGNFFQPTVLANVSSDSAIATQEIFGPVAVVHKFETEEDVIYKCNDTRAGLASYFYSRDIGRVWRVAEALEYGMVSINTGVLSAETVPFGGIKESGLGREGSPQGLDEYLETKYLCMGI